MQKERFFSQKESVQARQKKINTARQEVTAELDSLTPPRRYTGEAKRVTEALRKRLKEMAKYGQFPPIKLERGGE